MIGALYFLLWNSWKNRLFLRVRRLKQPKYLVGAIFGALYFFYVFGFRFLIGAHYPGGTANTLVSPENALMYESVGALILFAFVFLVAWVLPHERAALVFTEAEVAFLFPAPVSRRGLIHYKLLKSQVAILFMVLFFTLVFGRFWSGGMAWVRALGWWIILSTLNLHLMASSFVRTLLLEHGISNWKRRVLVLVAAVVAVTAIFIWAKRTILPPDVDNMHGRSDVEYYFQSVVNSGPLPYLLYPFRIVVRPYIEGVSGTLWTFLQALWPALLLMAAHYWFVIRADVAFEEASVEVSKRVAERVASIRANRGQWVSKPKKSKRPPFKLKPVGWPAVGLLWKNLIAAGSAFTWRFWLLMACVSIPIGSALASNPTLEALSIPVGMLLVMSFLIGPQILRQDFRQDLPMADVLRTYPVKGWQMALGQLLAPAVILTGLQWVLLILCASMLTKFGSEKIPVDARLAIACGMAIIAPGLNLVSLVIPNAAVLLFPGWFQVGKDAPQGIEATGQRLIFMFGQVIVFAVALIPASILFAVIYVIGGMMIGPWLPVPFAALGAGLVLLGEAWLGMLWLGKLFEKYDVSAENA